MKPILQVEDDPNDVFLLEHAMRKAGVMNPIKVATDGQQAIDYLKGIGKFSDRSKFPQPCLILLDLKLPYVMGMDVLKWIRQHAEPGMIVIIFSASSAYTDVTKAYRFGANAFLIKPSEATRLVEIAKAINDFWLIHNTLPHELFATETCPTAPCICQTTTPTSARIKRTRTSISDK